jgi:ABC-type transporter Mla subunit MlaD
MIIVCDTCHEEFEQEAFKGHPCAPPADTEAPAETPHGIPGFGELGQSIEGAEAHRIADLAKRVDQLPAVPTKSGHELALKDEANRMAILAKPFLDEIRRGLTTEVDTLRQDIADSNRLLKHLDVPLEQVADSHERAASSFERLRAEMESVSQRLAAVEGVIDTAGLTAAMSAAEERMASLAAAIRIQFTETSKNMAEVLKLLQRLQERDLDRTRVRVKRSSRRAVNKLRASPA